jgi:autotransporter-associated beta strand protein
VQTATFSLTTAGATTIDLEGLSSISNVTFSGTGVAAYTLGAGGPGAQVLTLTSNGILQLASTVGNPQRVDAALLLGDAAASAHTLRNDSPVHTLTLTGDVLHPGTGAAKALTAIGNGTILIPGSILSNGVNTLTVTNAAGHLALTGSGAFTDLRAMSPTTLAGANKIRTVYLHNDAPLYVSGSNQVGTLYFYGTGSTVVNIAEGGFLAFGEGGGGRMLSADQNAVVNGPGKVVVAVGPDTNPTGDNYCAPGKTLTVNADITGFRGLELWSGSGTYVLNGRNDFQGNLSMGPASVVCSKIGMRNATDSNLGVGTTVSMSTGLGVFTYTGTGETTDRTFTLGGTNTLDMSGTGHLVFTTALGTGGGRTVTLRGSTEGSAELAAALPNNSANLLKQGSGTWILSANNANTGVTTVDGGTLALRGNTVGKLTSSTAYVLNGGTLLLDNTAAANSTDRLRNASPVTLNGGTLTFSNDAGAADFSEAAGELRVASGASVVSSSRAAAGRTSALTFASLARTGEGTVDFQGDGLGEADNRNRILITAQAAGPLPAWATVNGQPAAYSASLGVYALSSAPTPTGLPARGPSPLPDAPALPAVIDSDGTEGPIALAAALTRAASITQDTATPAVFDTAGKTLQTESVTVPAGKASVTLGVLPGDGLLAPLYANGTLVLANHAAEPLTVNAAVANNTGASSLVKRGDGPVVLAGGTAHTGTTLIETGTLTVATPESRPDTLTGTLSGSGALAKTGPGALTLAAANTYEGGTTVAEGALTAATESALGAGPVLNNADLTLAAPNDDGDLTYKGIQTAMSGNGAVHIMLPANIARFPGDFSSFTGTWHVSPPSAAGARLLLSGPDNAAATLNVASNANVILFPSSGDTLFDNVHRAALVLGGGTVLNASDGTLRLDAGVEQAGPVTFLGPSDTAGRGSLHAYGESTVSGPIDNNGASFTLTKSGSAALNLTGDNTFTGPFHILAGSIRVPRLGSVAGGPSPLGDQPDAASATLSIGYTTSAANLVYTGPGETTDRPLALAGTTGGANLYAATTGTVTFAGPVSATSPGNKTLTLYGAPAAVPVPFQGTGVISGAISDYDAASTNSITKSDASVWILSGDNTFKGNVTVNNGRLILRHSNALGTGPKITSNGSNTAGEPRRILDGSAGNLTFPADITWNTSEQTEGAIINEAGDNTILGPIRLTSGDGDTAVTVYGGTLTLAGNIAPNASESNRGLLLRGDGDGFITGTITDGVNPLTRLVKEHGTGTWLLSGDNTLTGAAAANDGTLVIGGVSGRLSAIASVAASATGTFVITNAPDANLADRVSDTAPATLANGGTLRFAHPGGDADYAETLGALSVSGTDTARVVTSRADEGRTSALTFDSLTRAAPALLDFSGDGLGADDRNRVFLTDQPDGLIGAWATLDGAPAAYSPSLGVYADDGTLSPAVPAKGPFALASSASFARIAAEGTDGPLTLATPSVSIPGLRQDSGWASTVALPGQTLLTGDIVIAPGKAALTIGTAPGEGTLAPLSGTLSLLNASEASLTVNAAVADNGTTAATLVKAGPGIAVLNGTTAHTGPTLVSGGTLEVHTAAPLAGPVTVSGGALEIHTADGSTSAALAATAAVSGGTLEIHTGDGATNALAGAVSGSGTLVKDGPGRLDLNVSNSGFTGNITVRGGTLYPKHNSAFGSTAGTTTVEPGGAIDIGNNATAQDLNFGREKFIISGDGPDGKGAIVQSRNLSQYNAIHDIVLAGDTTFGMHGGSASRFDARTTGTFDMGGHTLTKTGPGLFGITSVSITNPGHIDVQQGTVRTESSARFNGDASNTLTVRSGSRYEIYALSTPAPWSLVMENNATFSALNANTATANIWAGPASLQGTARFEFNGQSATLAGEVSGPGTLWKAGTGTLYVTGTNNTYAGGTVLSNGLLRISNPGGLPGYATPGAFAVCNRTDVTNTLVLYSGDGTTGWTDAQLDAFLAANPFNSARSTFGIDLSGADIDHALPLTGPMSFATYGSGTLVQRGNVTLTGASTFNTFNSTVFDLAPGCNATVAGNTYVNDTSTFYLTNSNTYAANAFVVEESARLHLGPGSTLTTTSSQDFHVRGSQNAKAFIDGTLAAGRDIYIARNASGDRATLVVNDGTVTTPAASGRLYIGHSGTGRAGAVILNGGVMHIGTNYTGATVTVLGQQGSYGYLRLNGGELRTGQFTVNDNNTSGDYRNTTGVADFNGGTLTLTKSGGWLMHGWQGGYGAFNVRNGTVKGPAGSNATALNYAADRSAYGIINLLGPDGFLDATGSPNTNGLDLARGTGNQAGVLNLNGGTLRANLVYASRSAGSSAATPSFVNFNGGTLLARPETTKAATFLQGLTFATVYPGGAVIDSSNAVNITVAQNLTAPEGHGVASVPLASGGAGYIGAPFVVISGGSGTGATAIAEVDLDAGTVTSITVTSPGFGYQPGDMLTVTLRGGGCTTPAAAAFPVLAPNVPTGGLTKLGSGTLTLAGTNTYGGTTAIGAGTLKLASPLSLPSDTAVTVAEGATLDLNGATVTNAVSGGGTVANGTLHTVISPAGEGVIGAETLTLSSASLTGLYLADVTADGASDHLTVNGGVNLSGLAVTLVAPGLLNRQKVYTLAAVGNAVGLPAATNLPDPRWHLSLAPDGTLKLLFTDGTLLFMK